MPKTIAPTDASKAQDAIELEDARNAVKEIDEAVEFASGVAESLHHSPAPSQPTSTTTASDASPEAHQHSETHSPTTEQKESLSTPQQRRDDRREAERNETSEQRAKRMVARAKDQKQRGLAELSKVYEGVMSVEKDLIFYDVNIGSSAERFLGVIDLALSTLVRRGPAAIGAQSVSEILDRFQEMIGEYLAEANEARSGASAVLKNEKDSTLSDWISPKYTCAAFKFNMHAKHRFTIQLTDGLASWDRAITDLTVVEWNGVVDSSQVAQARELERRRHSAIFGFALKTLQGIKARTMPPIAKPKQSVAEHDAVATTA